MNIEQIGIDIGKNMLHLIALNFDDKIVLRKQFSRTRLIEFLRLKIEENTKIAFEACSGVHWLAHQLLTMGYEVQLLTPESVRRFVKAQKNDWNDALSVAEATGRPGRHSVGIKSQEQLVFKRYTEFGSVS